jgi:hypothetical protein
MASVGSMSEETFAFLAVGSSHDVSVYNLFLVTTTALCVA